MPAVPAGTQSQHRKKGRPQAAKQSTLRLARPTLEKSRNYTVLEGAVTMGVAAITVWRAIYNGYLEHYRVGRRVLVSGAQLIAWRDAGGKTGHSAKGGGERHVQ
jgi:excisionase family DNA binding protein